MEKLNVFIDKSEVDKLFAEEKYKNCMDKKYFEYIESIGKREYIDKYLENSKNKGIVESLVSKNKAIKVIDRLSVKRENHRFVGELENLGIYNIEVSKKIEAEYQDQILTKGVFALITLEENIDKKYPYYIEEIEVLEDININLDDYRIHFSNYVREHSETGEKESLDSLSDEEAGFMVRMDLVLNTIGISTDKLTFWEKVLFLIRLIPICESNYNLMELGGNGIGKTKTYSMFSPECEIVQEMLTTELIYNMQSKTKGLLDTKDVIVFDEVNKIKLDGDKEKITSQLLNFMSEGKTTSPRKITSKTSLVFSGNVMEIEERLERDAKNIFDNPHKLEDNAFCDRIHFFIPAWGQRRYSRNIHGINSGRKVFRLGYFSKVLSLLRKEDYSSILDDIGYEFKNGSEREILAIRKTVSGLLKLTYPGKGIDNITLEAYIAIAIKGRGLINKFLHNKNTNNVNKINIKVERSTGMLDYEEVDVNDSLKIVIYNNNFSDLNERFDKYEEHIRKHYNSKKDRFIHSFLGYFYEGKKIEDKVFYNLRFYPNRIIALFNHEEDKGEIVFIKIALDNLGIIKNKREEVRIKEIYGEKSMVDLSEDGKILSFIIPQNHGRFKKILNIENNRLFDKKELNYDGLFGDQSLDENDFTGEEYGVRRFEADISNLYQIDKDKKLKLENGEYIKPKFVYSENLDTYYYEDSNPKNSENKVVSEKMTYVEFKYFLANNGFIDLK